MDFSSALIAMRMGIPMRRPWQGDPRAVFLIWDQTALLQAHFELRDPSNSQAPRFIWLPTTQDILATDWERGEARAEPTVAELIQAGKVKPPTQGVVAQGFEAFGPMGARQ